MESPRTPIETFDPGTSLRVGGWDVEPRGLLLQRGSETIRLEPRVMGLLVCLAENAGRPVTRDELLERVWSEVVVGDDAIHSAVSKLRRALQASGASNAIETIPKIGYRLKAPVEWRMRANGERLAATDSAAAESPAFDDTVDAATGSRRRGWVAVLLVALAAIVALGVLTRLRSGSSGSDSASSAAGEHADTGVSAPQHPGPQNRPDVRPVAATTGLEVEPALAPGDRGDRVAFAWPGPEGDNWDIWVRVLGAGEPLRLTFDPASDVSPAWSPNGRHLAFIRLAEGSCAVMQVPALGGAEKRLGACAEAESLEYSPDGLSLVWAERSGPSEPFRIVALDLQKLERRELTAPPPGSVGDLGPEISPDSSTLAFLRSPVLGVEDIYLQSIDGDRKPRRLTTDALKIHGADWMSDGRSLVFSSNRGGLFSLWQIGIDGGEPRWLGAAGGDLDAPSVGAGGRLVAYEQWSDDANIYAVDLSPDAEPRRLPGSTRWDWAPDAARHSNQGGGQVVFVSDRSGSSELWAQELDGAASARQLTELGGPYVNHPRWSPDGSAIAFDARPGGKVDIYVLAADELRAIRVTEHPAQDLVPSWSRDGARLYFASDRDGSWQLWRVPLVGGEPEAMTTAGGYYGQESADGRWLYFSRRHVAGIWRRPLVGSGPAEWVVDDLMPIDRTHWVVGEDSLLYFRRPRHDRAVLTRVDLATGRIDELADLGPVTYNSGLALTADGAAALFTRYDRRESDILVLELGG